MPAVKIGTAYDELAISKRKSAFAVQVEVNRADLGRIAKTLGKVDHKFRIAAGRVVAAFGAYMPYSAALEFGYTHYLSNKWHKAKPHIIPAINENKAAIKASIAEAYAAILEGVIQERPNFTTVNGIQEQMEMAWNVILNGKVKADAIARANQLGLSASEMHISTIRGWGKAPSADWIRSQQVLLMQTKRSLYETRKNKKLKNPRAVADFMLMKHKKGWASL